MFPFHLPELMVIATYCHLHSRSLKFIWKVLGSSSSIELCDMNNFEDGVRNVLLLLFGFYVQHKQYLFCLK